MLRDAPRTSTTSVQARRLLSWLSLGLPPVLALTCIAIRPFGYLPERMYDDSFYYLQIADNIVSGHGSTLDGLTPTNGYQPLWMLVCIAMRALISDRWTLMVALACVQVLIASAGLVILERSWRRSLGGPLASLAVLALSAQIYWSFLNVMESGLNLLFLALISWLIVGRPVLVSRRAHVPIVAAILAGAVYTRLDNAILVVAILTAAFAAATTDRRREPLLNTALVAAATGAALLPYALVNLYAFGHMMPMSGLAKQLVTFVPGTEPSHTARLWSLLTSTAAGLRHSGLTFGAVLVAPPLVLWLLRAPRTATAQAWMYAGTLAGLFLLFLGYGYFSVEGLYDWYLLPFSIATMYLTAVAAKRIGPQAGVIAIAALAVWLFAGRSRTELDVARYANYDIRTRAATLARLADDQPTATFAGWNAGFTSYALGGRVTNLDGLVSSQRYVTDYLARGKTIDFILEQRFDFIVDYDHFLGTVIPQTGRWAGMSEDAYRRLVGAYDLCAPQGLAWDLIVLVRKDFTSSRCEPRQVITRTPRTDGS